ncbi:MAG: hypothetical protein QM522_00160 [Chitinophagaceae bacterium]|nr:hypothetical protein [Chitinophagaceae bacterium]
MPIHLHIGTHKTGTTAIQRQLQRNREALKRQGIWYPNEAELLPGGSTGIPHRNIARSLNSTAAPKPYDRPSLRTMAQAILGGARDYDHTIISSEAFWRIGFPAQPEHCSLEKIWQRKLANVASIRQLFADGEVRVHAVLRERSAYIQSSYSEFVLATLYREDIHAYLSTYGHGWDYLQQLQAWSAHFPVEAHAYETLCIGNRLPLEFLRALCGEGLPDDILAADPNPLANVSDPLACISFKRFLNQQPIRLEKRDRLYRKYRRIFRKAAKRAKPSQTVQQLAALNSWLPTAELRSLQRALAKNDREIRAAFCADLVSSPPKRFWPLPWQSDRRQPLSPAEHDKVVRWMLGRQPLKPAWLLEPEADNR